MIQSHKNCIILLYCKRSWIRASCLERESTFDIISDRRQNISTMQSSASAGNNSAAFHPKTTRCLGITQLAVGITLAILAGCTFGLEYDDNSFLSGIFGSILAMFTLFFSGIFGICSAKYPANLYLNCTNMGMAIICSIFSVTQVVINCLVTTYERFHSWCSCYSYFQSQTDCDCYAYVQYGQGIILLQTLTTMVELAICIGVIIVCFKNGCNKCCWNRSEAAHGNSVLTQQIPYNPRYGLLAGENQAGTYGSIAPNNARSTQYQQHAQGGVWPGGSTVNQIQGREDAELFAKFQNFLSTTNQLQPATRVRDQPHLHNVNQGDQPHYHHANPFMNQYQGPARINNPYNFQGQQTTANAPFQSNANMPAQITVNRTVQNIMDTPPHLPETNNILQPTVRDRPLAAAPSPSTVESEKFEEQQRQQVDAAHNRAPIRQDTSMPTEAPPAYEEKDTAP